jgi:hypothetical protein
MAVESQVGQDLADHRSELESMTGKPGSQDHFVLPG